MIRILELGLTDYNATWKQQKQLQQQLIDGDLNDYLIVCRHNPVITLGRSADRSNVLNPENIPVIEIERGGDVTYHGPDQVVLYPILNLNRYKRDVGCYLRDLEEVTIQTLSKFNIAATRIQGKTGVWLKDPEQKIASLGIRISRWCTLHGMAINVLKTDAFKAIHPCGLKDVNMTNIQTHTGREDAELIAETSRALVDSFLSTFNMLNHEN